MDTHQQGTDVPINGTPVPRRKRRSIRDVFANGFQRQLRLVCDGYGRKKAAAAAMERTTRSVGNYLNGERKPCFTDVIMLARKFKRIREWLHAMTHAPEHMLERLNAEVTAMEGQLEEAERRFAASLEIEQGQKPSFRNTAIAALKGAGHFARHPVKSICDRRRKAVEAA